ncbi:MAG: hypothetical protein IJT62_00875 [Oscillospiraceae bacterium]|nr:hypothetical protein [Oscillospiraceae bacterium]
MEKEKNIITCYPEGLDYLEKKLNVLGLPRFLMTGLRKKLIKSLILTLARQ